METQTNLTFRIIFFALFFAVLVIRGYYGRKLRKVGQRSGEVTHARKTLVYQLIGRVIEG